MKGNLQRGLASVMVSGLSHYSPGAHLIPIDIASRRSSAAQSLIAISSLVALRSTPQQRCYYLAAI